MLNFFGSSLKGFFMSIIVGSSALLDDNKIYKSINLRNCLILLATSPGIFEALNPVIPSLFFFYFS
jgi:hypothetical protein